MSKQKIILFDIDYTLFDTTKYKRSVAENLANLITVLDPQKAHDVIETVYYEVRKLGSFNPKIFAEFFAKKFSNSLSVEEIEEVWWRQDILQSAIYPEVVPTLKLLQEKNELMGIFSSGRTEFQMAKISFMQDFFAKDHVHIASFKEDTLPDLLAKYQEDTLYLVDDFISILERVKQEKTDAVTVWMKRGKFAEKAVIPAEFIPDATIAKLDELPTFLDNWSGE